MKHSLDDPLLDAKEVMASTLLSKATLLRKTNDGTFPPPRYLGLKRVWYTSEIEEWIHTSLRNTPTHNNVNPGSLNPAPAHA